MAIRIFTSIFLFIFFPAHSFALDAKTAGPNPTPLFASDGPIQIQIRAPFKELFEARSKSNFVAGALIYQNLKIPAQIRVRGFYSLEECEFPKLLLHLDKDAIRGTIFEKNDKLDVGTHCFADLRDEGMAHPFREAMVYKWMNSANLVGYSARTAKITYIESTDETAKPEFEGFLLENMKGLLKRTSGIEIGLAKSKPSVADSDKIKYLYDGEDASHFEPLNLARFHMFELMIGNQDVRLGELHNVKLIEADALDKNIWTLVPMDFNLSQLAMGFTTPADDLAMSMRGYISTEQDRATYKQALGEFLSEKNSFYQSLSLLGPNDTFGTQMSRESLDLFFDALKQVLPELAQTLN